MIDPWRLQPDDDRRWEEKRDRETAPSELPRAVRRAIAAHAQAGRYMVLHRQGQLFKCSVDWLLYMVAKS